MLPGPGGVNVRLADTRRLDARGGWQGGEPGRSETIGFSAGQRGRAVAHRQPGERAGGALVVLRPQLRALQPLLLRPDRPHAAARPGVHPARGAVGDQPRARPARRPRLRARRRQPGRRCPAAPGSTCRWWSPRAASPRCRSRARCCASRRASCPAPSTSWPGRCARCPGIESVRVTVGGSPVPLPNGRIDTPVTEGQEYDAAGTGAAFFWGLRGGRIVDLGSDPTAIGGPLGQAGLLAAQLRGQRDASPDRRRVRARGTRSTSRRRPGPRARPGPSACSTTAPTCCARSTTCSATSGWSTAPPTARG